ncbi:hypothetical protein L1987_75446 [Smallanthus sonchifolius]|uniref:Uncharacterized protein n=1 Tax=Smallanthus sonchifolius TaxID=185202 RepID=A0ACB9A4Z0_9ASTR|nr:hypothetical protein L1987_75446 [Smallanthus sonchifolius]
MSLEELLPEHRVKSRALSILIRTGLVFSILFVALTIPFFGLVMSLIGSLLTMLVRSLCVLIIIVGTISSAIGTYTSMSEIIQQLS